MVSKLLVATDGSDYATKAVKSAIKLARQTKASMILLSVVSTEAIIAQSIPSEASPLHVMEPIEDYLRRAAEGYLDKAEKLCSKNGIKVSRSIRSGHPVKEIIKEARKTKASMIVMGSHGKGALESALLGSVTLGVIHENTKFPVLVIR